MQVVIAWLGHQVAHPKNKLAQVWSKHRLGTTNSLLFNQHLLKRSTRNRVNNVQGRRLIRNAKNAARRFWGRCWTLAVLFRFFSSKLIYCISLSLLGLVFSLCAPPTDQPTNPATTPATMACDSPSRGHEHPDCSSQRAAVAPGTDSWLPASNSLPARRPREPTSGPGE